MPRVVNYTCTLANTWYKVFDESDYQSNRIKEVKVKLREDTTADHFRYAYKPDTGTALTFTNYITSTSGFTILKRLQKLYCYIPSVANQIIEMELIYY